MAEKIVEVDGKRYMKVQKGKYFNKKKSRKMKRHHPVRWILISAFCLLIVAPVGFIFGAFYDSNTKDVANTETKFTDNLMNNITQGVMNIAKNEGRFEMNLDNNFLDSLLYIAQEKIQENPTISQFIKKLYVNIQDNQYDFTLDVQASFFKTRVHVMTTLNSPETNSNAYVFTVNNIVLGRLPLGNLAKSILPQFISDEQINQALAAIPLRATFSLSNMEITYEKSKIKEDLFNILDTADIKLLDSPFASVLLNLYDELDPKATFYNGVTFSMDFKKLAEAEISDPSTAIGEGIKAVEKTYSAKVAEFLNNKNISLDSSKSNLLFQYFLTGYTSDLEENLFKDNQTLQDACTEYIGTSYSSWSGNKAYTDYKITKDELYENVKIIPGKIQDVSEKAIKENDVSLISIDSKNLSNFLRSTPLMGYTIGMPLKTNDKYDFAYITFDDFSVTIADNELDILANINFNGYDMPLSIKTSVTTTGDNLRDIKITPTSFYIGTIDLNEMGIMDTMLSFISQSFTGGDLVTFDSNTKSFVLKTSMIQVPSKEEEVLKFFNNLLLGESITIPVDSDPKVTVTIPANKIKFSCKQTADKGLEFTIREIEEN